MTTLTTTSAPLLKDLIAIPERVHQGDFVLKLADGLEHAKATVGRRSAMTRWCCFSTS